ncbi:MAG: 4Fe-4S dicluster domain-containing protein [Marinilabiliales bacterium]|nr:4Fe-4S dicluster domain-containing protein [Marinilabiliales bacterium]
MASAEIESCFNCGNCTAICPLATDETPSPRNNIRMVQLGLRDRLRSSLDPWLCYYCGDCSATCPRKAEPGEAQMTMRRWLTGQYDWTGLARLFYTSPFWEIASIVLVSASIVWMFILFAASDGDRPCGAQHLRPRGTHPLRRLGAGGFPVVLPALECFQDVVARP